MLKTSSNKITSLTVSSFCRTQVCSKFRLFSQQCLWCKSESLNPGLSMQHATKTWLWTIVSLVPSASPIFLLLAVRLFCTASDRKLGRPGNEANYSSRRYWSIAWPHACRKNRPVECEELGTILRTTVTSTLANWTDGQPQLIQRIMKASGMFPLPSV